MVEPATITQVFNRMIEAFSFLETSEKKAVIRSLRIIYFYPDELLGVLNELIETDAADPEKAIAVGAGLLPDQTGVEESLAFITSKSVTTNLKLSIEMVEQLREIADFKVGVRGNLHSMFFTWMFTRDKDELLKLARVTRDEIVLLNSKIRTLEKTMDQPKTGTK
jgi:hypothetical protein